MNNRFGSSSILLTASSSDFSYLLKGRHGVRQISCVYYKKYRKMNYKNLTVLARLRHPFILLPATTQNFLNMEKNKNDK